MGAPYVLQRSVPYEDGRPLGEGEAVPARRGQPIDLPESDGGHTEESEARAA